MSRSVKNYEIPDYVFNPKTNRNISTKGRAFVKLVRDGHIDLEQFPLKNSKRSSVAKRSELEDESDSDLDEETLKVSSRRKHSEPKKKNKGKRKKKIMYESESDSDSDSPPTSPPRMRRNTKRRNAISTNDNMRELIQEEMRKILEADDTDDDSSDDSDW